MADQQLEEMEERDVDINPRADVDEASSEVVTLNTPLRHEVIQFDWLHCKYSKRGSNQSTATREEKSADEEGGPGTIVCRSVVQ